MIKMRNETNTKGLLYLIKELPNDIVMAEIGCYAGESTSLFLKSGKVKKLYAIDPWQINYDINDTASTSDFDMVEKEFDKRVVNFNVIKLKMTMKEAINILPELDVIYIDGNHTYDFVFNDIKLSLQKIRKNGIISGHDYNNVDVKNAVNNILVKPDMVFSDSSWLKYI